jgi:hypothetical protein
MTEHYERVKDLCRRIYKDTMLRSDPALDHPLYAELVGMGQPVVPALLRRLDDFEDPDDMSIWHPLSALHDITGVNVIPEEDRGRLFNIIEHWLNWGREQGIKWDD